MKLLRRSAMPMVIISIKYSVLLLVFPLVNIVTGKPFYLLIALLQISDNQLCLGKGGGQAVARIRRGLLVNEQLWRFFPPFQSLFSLDSCKGGFSVHPPLCGNYIRGGKVVR